MKRDRLDFWLKVIGNLAIVISLVVVAIEMNQNSIVANGELSSQFQVNWMEMDRSRQEPSFAIAYAKSIEQPESLSLAEKVQLDGYYWTAMDQLDLARDLVGSGLFNGTYEQIAGNNIRIIFTTPYAQAWWEANRVLFHPVTLSIGDDVIKTISPNTAQALFDSIDSKLAE